MSLILLPLNPAKDAVLVDINNQPITIDDSTPIEVNVQQPVSVDDNGGSLTIDGEVGVTNLAQVLSDRQAARTIGEVDTTRALNEILIELKMQTEMMRHAFDFDITEKDIPK